MLYQIGFEFRRVKIFLYVMMIISFICGGILYTVYFMSSQFNNGDIFSWGQSLYESGWGICFIATIVIAILFIPFFSLYDRGNTKRSYVYATLPVYKKSIFFIRYCVLLFCAVTIFLSQYVFLLCSYFIYKLFTYTDGFYEYNTIWFSTRISKLFSFIPINFLDIIIAIFFIAYLLLIVDYIFVCLMWFKRNASFIKIIFDVLFALAGIFLLVIFKQYIFVKIIAYVELVFCGLYMASVYQKNFRGDY